MAVSLIGIVTDDDVSRMQLVRFKSAANRLQSERNGPQQNRYIRSLSDESPSAVKNRCDEIPRLAKDRRARRQQHDLAHLFGDRVQAIRNHGNRDGIVLYTIHKILFVSPRFSSSSDNRLLLASEASPAVWICARDITPAASRRSAFHLESPRE